MFANLEKTWTPQEAIAWNRFRDKRRLEFSNSENSQVQKNHSDNVSWFEFLQYNSSVASNNPNPFSLNNEIEYSLETKEFGPDFRQIKNLQSPNHYLNRINSTYHEQFSHRVRPTPSFYRQESQFGVPLPERNKNNIFPNNVKRTDPKFLSPYSYYLSVRIQHIDKEQPNLKKSQIPAIIANEWADMNENKRENITDLWRNYLSEGAGNEELKQELEKLIMNS